MIKFQRAFTIMEVLVSLTIIAILATLISPKIIKDVQNKKNGALLGKSVEITELGCQNIIQHYIDSNSANVSLSLGYSKIVTPDDLFKLSANGGARFFGLTDTHNSNYIQYVIDGSKSSVILTGITNSPMVQEKTGVYMGAINKSEETGDTPDKTDLIKNVIYIDTNGAKAPNRFGKDIFAFGLTDRCKMIPAGTSRMNNVLGINGTSGLEYTERVVRNGYKIDY